MSGGIRNSSLRGCFYCGREFRLDIALGETKRQFFSSLRTTISSL